MIVFSGRAEGAMHRTDMIPSIIRFWKRDFAIVVADQKCHEWLVRWRDKWLVCFNMKHRSCYLPPGGKAAQIRGHKVDGEPSLYLVWMNTSMT